MAIQQHPLPQDISSYRFRLIGDMTLKQFASLGICLVLAIIFYSFPLPFFFKYPLVFFFVLLGFGTAFVPVQGRTLDVWLIAFIKSIYSPTQYVWKKTSVNQAAPANPAPTATPAPIPQTEASVSASTPVSTPTSTSTPSSLNSPISPPTAPSTPPVPPSTPPVTIAPPTPQVPTPASTSTPAPIINLPIPFTPTTPNTLVGLTLTSAGRILDGVLVEIKKENLTLRATKSNKLGQFMFARPLEPGLYQILAEKEGHTFSPYSLQLTNEIVKPLKIQAQN